MRCVARWVLAVLLLAGAASPPKATGQDPTPTPILYLEHLADATDFERVSVEDFRPPDRERTGKYLAPVRTDASLLPTHWQNVNLYPLHIDFLRNVFPERFAGLTPGEYLDLIERRATRSYYAGGFYQLIDYEGHPFWGFDVYTVRTQDELLEQGEVGVLYAFLSAACDLRPLAYAPTTPEAILKARSWVAPPFPVYLREGLELPTYEAYTRTTNYGRVRTMTVQEFDAAARNGEIGWQDIVALDGVPFDLEIVVAGILTGERQTELSHVNVRSARRGTPNAFVERANEALAPFEGQLVRLALGAESYTVDADVALAEAEAWWDAHRPRLRRLVRADYSCRGFPALREMPETASTGLLATRYGGKAANLAVLYRTLDAEHQVPAFAIPFAYYRDFMETNLILDTYHSPMRQVTYQTYLESLWDDPAFRGDSALRNRLLAEFRDHARRYGYVPRRLVLELADRIGEVWGSQQTMVRFRSSSNLEDDLGFSAAGLHDSTSVCAEDSLDSDNYGPSRCDVRQDDERSIERGLRVVWSSLWNVRANEEREWYQIPPREAAMAVLVTTAFPDEAANGVVFSGDPDGAYEDYLVNVNPGDYSVVHPDPSMLPERDLLKRTGCTIDRIVRLRGSSFLPPGDWALSEGQLRHLGEVLCSTIEATFPVDTQGYERDEVRLDLEFKFTQEGRLIFKQVRPFLVTSAAVPRDEGFCLMQVPTGQGLTTRFIPGRGIRDEYEAMARIQLHEGDFWLPRDLSQFESDLVERLELGPAALRAAPRTRGAFAREVFSIPGETTFRYRFYQAFEAGGLPVCVTGEGLAYTLVGEATLAEPILLDDSTILEQMSFEGTWGERQLWFTSATLDTVPEYRTCLTFAGGDGLVLVTRRANPADPEALARLVRAELVWGGEARQVDDDRALVLSGSAATGLVYWVLLEPAQGDLFGIEVVLPAAGTPQAYRLDATRERAGAIAIESFGCFERRSSVFRLR